MRGLWALILVLAPQAQADPVQQCLSCHVTAEGALDIVALPALRALPPEWPYMFEDGFDLDGDGIAGRMRFVRGQNGPIAAKFGATLAAGRFQDFALIAGAAHGVNLSSPQDMNRVLEAFEQLSPMPALPDAQALEQFQARGCARCHVTATFAHASDTYMPLSDFLLHDTPNGPRRTTPLWGCRGCLDAPNHSWLE